MRGQSVGPDWYEDRRSAERIARERKDALKREAETRGPFGLRGWTDARVRLVSRFGETTWRR